MKEVRKKEETVIKLLKIKRNKVSVLTAEWQSGFLRRRLRFVFRHFRPGWDLRLLFAFLLLEKRNENKL